MADGSRAASTSKHICQTNSKKNQTFKADSAYRCDLMSAEARQGNASAPEEYHTQFSQPVVLLPGFSVFFSAEPHGNPSNLYFTLKQYAVHLDTDIGVRLQRFQI